MNVKVLILSALLLLGWPLFSHERDRYRAALHECMDAYVKNEHTLSRDVCAVVGERERCSESIRASCLQAERENRISPADCARLKWFQQGEWVGLYMRVAGSPWTLIPLVAVVLLGSLYIFAMFRTSENMHKRMIDSFHGDFGHLRRLPPIQASRNIEYERE